LKRQAGSHQRYLFAIKTLATVRKLLKPAPSTLELLGYPAGKGAGDVGKQRPRRELAAAMAGTPRWRGARRAQRGPGGVRHAFVPDTEAVATAGPGRPRG